MAKEIELNDTTETETKAFGRDKWIPIKKYPKSAQALLEQANKDFAKYQATCKELAKVLTPSVASVTKPTSEEVIRFANSKGPAKKFRVFDKSKASDAVDLGD